MKKVLFLYDIEDDNLWRDGLWAAIQLLSQDFDITWANLRTEKPLLEGYDFILAWGGYNSSPDKYLTLRNWADQTPTGLCLGGYAMPYNLPHFNEYDVVFYECDWAKGWLEDLGTNTKLVHAFGVNTSIYKPLPMLKVWDYITVGSFSLWKRQLKLLEKEGNKLAIGQIQKGNLNESLDIAGNLLLNGCAVSDMILPEGLALLYNASKACYIPAETMGGGERSVLEARACGIPVEIEPDNPKLQELLTSPVWDHVYYAEQLKKGILEVIGK